MSLPCTVSTMMPFGAAAPVPVWELAIHEPASTVIVLLATVAAMASAIPP